ncbi:hypothetical protein BXZ70DRAFT_198527 [Cristinia sonorae]|uniref:Uncharacterized protein n=1 Tax=Cristinia sonorae TaxID=1940300 RepID=A0A8K0UN69_9AGAR|nr:hypothetical protein BXZ70DRAFT_198527 [Cristinia sonorae]
MESQRVIYRTKRILHTGPKLPAKPSTVTNVKLVHVSYPDFPCTRQECGYNDGKPTCFHVVSPARHLNLLLEILNNGYVVQKLAVQPIPLVFPQQEPVVYRNPRASGRSAPRAPDPPTPPGLNIPDIVRPATPPPIPQPQSPPPRGEPQVLDPAPNPPGDPQKAKMDALKRKLSGAPQISSPLRHEIRLHEADPPAYDPVLEAREEVEAPTPTPSSHEGSSCQKRNRPGHDQHAPPPPQMSKGESYTAVTGDDILPSGSTRPSPRSRKSKPLPHPATLMMRGMTRSRQ